MIKPPGHGGSEQVHKGANCEAHCEQKPTRLVSKRGPSLRGPRSPPTSVTCHREDRRPG